MRLFDFLKLIVTSHSGISSKRVCGVIGFGAVLFVLIYCTIFAVQAPLMIDTFIYAICILLGVDSVTGIWKNVNNSSNELQESKDSESDMSK